MTTPDTNDPVTVSLVEEYLRQEDFDSVLDIFRDLHPAD